MVNKIKVDLSLLPVNLLEAKFKFGDLVKKKNKSDKRFYRIYNAVIYGIRYNIRYPRRRINRYQRVNYFK